MHPPRRLLRVVVVWLSAALALLAMELFLSGLTVSSPGSALVAAALIALGNALIWPLVIRLALPFTVLTLGLGALVLNGLLVYAIGQLSFDGFEVANVGTGVVVAFGLTLATTLATTVLSVDDDAVWYRNVVRRSAQRRAAREGRAIESDVPGVLFLEIDGLAHAVVVRAVRDGNMPTVASWLREGSHRLERWETDWSSQTGACQAGLLHGDNHDWPAFRWWEKDRGAAIVTNHPRDAATLEARHSDGRGLLHEDGCSRANILSGDAAHSMLTMSTVLEGGRGPIGQDYVSYFLQPYAAARTLLLAIADIAQERWYAAQQRRLDIRPRVPRSRLYALVRAWATVVQRDLQVAAVLGDVAAGRPVVYTTFLAYDEVAHHSGVERPDALATLRRVDHQIGRVARAVRDAPRPYRLVVLADHGQSQGATFRDRYGHSLDELVRDACGLKRVAASIGGGDEAIGYLGAGLTEASSAKGAAGRALRGATRSRTRDGAVALERGPEAATGDGIPELSVMASGCLGIVSFPREPGRVSLERIAQLHPGLIGALVSHPGIAFALVRSEARGAVALGPRGAHWLDEQAVEGEDPLAAFGPGAAAHVRRTSGFPHCPDIVVNSRYWEGTDEVAAFEELVGSHGGLGGEQSHPFVCFPASWSYPDGEVVGAEAMHRVLRRWMADLGHAAYREPVPA